MQGVNGRGFVVRTQKVEKKLQEIINVIYENPSSAIDVGDAMSVCYKLTRYYINLLVKDKEIYVSGWKEHSSRRTIFIPVYSIGYEKFIPRPKVPKAVSAKRTYEKRKQGDFKIDEDQIFSKKYANVKIPEVKQTWLSGLGL
jgi:hypothetical protein